MFERHSVSFASVTQLFNATTSMGRLMLNALLSFARFEREVTGKRIRDKIAAGKRKGMWMGDAPPPSYDVENRRLAPNEREAKLIRRFVELGSGAAQVKELKPDGMTVAPSRASTHHQPPGRESPRVTQRHRSAAARQRRRTPGAGVRRGEVLEGDRDEGRNRKQLREPDGQPGRDGARHPGRRIAQPRHAV